MKKLKITVLYGGESSEREVSLRTGQAMHNALVAGGYSNVKLLDAKRENISELSDPLTRPDLCLLALHGKYGEDGVIQGYLEMLNIPYTGSDVAASAVAFDKYLTKLCFDAENVPSADWWLSSDTGVQPSFPCVVKPAREGSTVGISIVKSAAEYDAAVHEASQYDEKVLVEKFVSGKELTITVLNGHVLPAIWIKPDSGFYDYKSKYTKGATKYLFDTGISDIEMVVINSTALKAYTVLGCEGVARVDIIYDGKTPYVLEVNTIPGMTETSLVPKAAAQAGISFLEVLEAVMNVALSR
jgi:D-alanine-D-alanine ligase